MNYFVTILSRLTSTTSSLITLILLLIVPCNRIQSWPLHDISTLRLLQIVHTHGDRTPSHFVPNDPYADLNTFWPEGVGQLTKKGRNRMHRIGQFFREAYQDFLRNQTDSLEFLYVRSSGSRRCLESASLLATGMMHNPHNRFNLGGNFSARKQLSDYDRLSKHWRPIPVHSVPKGSDAMLDSIAACPNSDYEFSELSQKSHKMQRIYEENENFLDEISRYAGEPIDSLERAYKLYQELLIESQYDYHWWKPPYRVWSEDYETYAISKLRELSRLYWSIQWDSKLLQTLRAGLLIEELNRNMRAHIDGTDSTRNVFVYSTHDAKIALLLHSFGMYDGFLIPPGATILLELHRKSPPQLNEQSDLNSNVTFEVKNLIDSYFVRIYYYNETYTSDWAYRMISDRVCSFSYSRYPDNDGITPQWSCSAAHFLAQTAAFVPYDWRYQCGISTPTTSIFAVNFYLLATNFIGLFVMFVILRLYSSTIRISKMIS